MSTLTITARTLRSALGPVIPLAGTDLTLPVLNAVHVHTEGPYLVATATDRFVMGIKRTPGVWPEGWAAIIPLPAIRGILAAYKPQRGHDPEMTLTVDGDRLVVSGGGGLFSAFVESQTTYLLETAEFPKVAQIVAQVADAEPDLSTVPAFNSKSLARFAAADSGGAGLFVHATNPARPALITDGETFWGAIMPRRRVDGVRPTLPSLVAPLVAQPEKPKRTRRKAS